MTDTKVWTPPTDRLEDVCFWCQETILDASVESGWTGNGPDWASYNKYGFDWGCDSHPINNENGVGPHETREDVREIVRKYHTGNS